MPDLNVSPALRVRMPLADDRQASSSGMGR